MAGLGTLMSAAMGIPVVGYLLAPVFKKSASRWVEVGPVANFSTDPKSTKISYTIEDSFRPVNKSMRLWVMTEAEKPVVYSTYCTHLGCTVSWKPNDNHFFCPCHDGVFAKDGAVISGPPPRPLDRLNSKIENGKIMVEV